MKTRFLLISLLLIAYSYQLSACSIENIKNTEAAYTYSTSPTTLVASLKYGDRYYIKNSYGNGSYLETCGHATCVNGTKYNVVTHTEPNRGGHNTGTWIIQSASGKRTGAPVLVGDIIYLKNVYGGGTYLETCGFGSCTNGTTYNVVTHTEANRGGQNTGKWKIVTATASAIGSQVTTNTPVYLKNMHSTGSYLDTCGHGSCTSGTKYNVTTNKQANRGGHNTGKWSFLQTTATTSGGGSINDLKIMTHNVYLINPPLGIAAAPNRTGRASAIANASYIKGKDIVILNELFDNAASDIIMSGLKSEYPHQTKVAGRGRDGWDSTSGDYRASERLEAGVAVLSKWPIERKEQFLFPKGDLCGWDAFSNKGFVYVRIKYKNNQKIHLIATHVQAADGGCGNKRSGFEHGWAERKREFQSIRSFLRNKSISKNDYVFIGGDLNVIKGTPEYRDMLSTLNAADVASTGHYATYDPARNALIDDKSLRSELLDYVLVSKDFKQPTKWFNHVAIPNGNFADHYPVTASVKALGSAISPPNYYEIAFHTGSLAGGVFGTESAGTDANIHITLIGSKGVSNEVYVNDKMAGDAFEANSKDVFSTETKDLGRLQKIRIRKANGDDWFMTGVDVKNEITGKVSKWRGQIDMSGGTRDFNLN